MHNLKNVSITLNKYYEVGNDTNMISTDELKSFLKSNKGQLDSIRVDMMINMMIERKCFSMCTALTNGGEIWTELHGLKLLDMIVPVFNNCKVLVKVINQQQKTIQSLGLICIRLGDSRGARYDWSNIALSIIKCRHLIRLNLNQHLLRDSDMEVLLSSLPNLKVLLLCGPIGSKGGHLTDKSCKIIARTCKELREINLAYQEKITITGIKRVLKSCQRLRNIRISLVLSQTDVISMHHLAPSLIFMTVRFGFNEECYGEVIEATNGLVVFHHYDTRTLEYCGDELSEETLRRFVDREALVDMYNRNVDNPKVIDDWAFLDTFKNEK